MAELACRLSDQIKLLYEGTVEVDSYQQMESMKVWPGHAQKSLTAMVM